MPQTTTTLPLGYIPPTWPALYWPINAPASVPQYLYFTADIWRFTLYWTLLFYLSSHLLVAFFAVGMQVVSAARSGGTSSTVAKSSTSPSRSTGKTGSRSLAFTLTWVPLLPLLYGLVGGIEALLAGSVVGLVLGAVYSAGYYKMSTWMPFLWGVINVLVLVLGGFRVVGGL